MAGFIPYIIRAKISNSASIWPWNSGYHHPGAYILIISHFICDKRGRNTYSTFLGSCTPKFGAHSLQIYGLIIWQWSSQVCYCYKAGHSVFGQPMGGWGTKMTSLADFYFANSARSETQTQPQDNTKLSPSMFQWNSQMAYIAIFYQYVQWLQTYQ